MTEQDFKGDEQYGAEQIKVLEGLEAVRVRPSMYIGSTGIGGLHHMVYEIVDNSIDEALAGHCKNITVILRKDGYLAVIDDGRGIPVDPHPVYKVSALQIVVTKLHAGGKFDKGSYAVSGGLHGVGASVVNALSIFMRVEVHKDGGIYVQEYSKGKRKAAVKKIGTTKKHGTIITFKPDIEIFKEIDFDFNRVVHHMRQQAYLVRGLKISVIDLRETKNKIKDTSREIIRIVLKNWRLRRLNGRAGASHSTRVSSGIGR